MSASNNLDLPSLQGLQSAEQIELLDVIDTLRGRGVSDFVALPQLIVCGDQSSGKSSVLEAISGIPFPRQDELCTRFATEVILRRATKDEISVTIVPGKGRNQNDSNRLRAFHPEIRTNDDFKDLFRNARDAMGLSSSGKTFSNDVLRVEFGGPTQPQLTLVDLPGLIHSESDSQTGDVKLVQNLVSQYMKNPRSIILAVVSAMNDRRNQIILRTAREIDPQGKRTLGIITKPDILASGSKSEEGFIALARNEEIKLDLGWHVVRNIDSARESNVSRDAQENDYFQNSNFNCLSPHIVGISFLRSRLSKVLFDQIRKHLPRLVEDIETQISDAETVREKLGSSRAKAEEQRLFLISLSQSFQSICRDAVRGDYDHKFFQDDMNPERRLCANVMNMHFSFAQNIRNNGASWIIQDEEPEDPKDLRYRTREEAIAEACALLKRSRGRELAGLPNPLLVGELFREYSSPWEKLARRHILNVWESTNRFLELLLKYLTDDDTCEKALRFWIYPLMEKRLSLAYEKLNELLEVHKDHPITTNRLFVKNNKVPQQKTDMEDIVKELVESGQAIPHDMLIRLLSLRMTDDNKDVDLIAAEEAFDNMNAFYEVFQHTFSFVATAFLTGANSM